MRTRSSARTVTRATRSWPPAISNSKSLEISSPALPPTAVWMPSAIRRSQGFTSPKSNLGATTISRSTLPRTPSTTRISCR